MSETEETTGPERYRRAVEVIHAAATERGLCSEADSVLESIGLPRRRPAGTFRATFRYEGTATYDGISAQNTESARRILSVDNPGGKAHAAAAARNAIQQGDESIVATLVEVERTDGLEDSDYELPDGLDGDSTEDEWDEWFARTGEELREALEARSYRGYQWVNEALDAAGFGGFPVQTMHEVTLTVTLRVPADDEDSARAEVDEMGSRRVADKLYSEVYGNGGAYQVTEITDTGEPHYQA